METSSQEKLLVNIVKISGEKLNRKYLCLGVAKLGLKDILIEKNIKP